MNLIPKYNLQYIFGVSALVLLSILPLAGIGKASLSTQSKSVSSLSHQAYISIQQGSPELTSFISVVSASVPAIIPAFTASCFSQKVKTGAVADMLVQPQTGSFVLYSSSQCNTVISTFQPITQTRVVVSTPSSLPRITLVKNSQLLHPILGALPEIPAFLDLTLPAQPLAVFSLIGFSGILFAAFASQKRFFLRYQYVIAFNNSHMLRC